MLYLLQKLYPLFQNSKNPEDIHPLLGEILLILSADTEKDYLHALDLFSSCRQILELCNEICRQTDWNFSLDLAIAADAGRAEKLIIPGSGPFPDAVAWTGIHEERASRISHAMEKGVHKDTLITHSFYKHLPEKQKRNTPPFTISTISAAMPNNKKSKVPLPKHTLLFYFTFDSFHLR